MPNYEAPGIQDVLFPQVNRNLWRATMGHFNLQSQYKPIRDTIQPLLPFEWSVQKMGSRWKEGINCTTAAWGSWASLIVKQTLAQYLSLQDQNVMVLKYPQYTSARWRSRRCGGRRCNDVGEAGKRGSEAQSVLSGGPKRGIQRSGNWSSVAKSTNSSSINQPWALLSSNLSLLISTRGEMTEQRLLWSKYLGMQ